MAIHGYSAPVVLAANRGAWSAFIRVCQIRHAPMGQPWMPNWSDIATVLEVYDLWNADVHGRLSTCFSELMMIEAEQKATDGKG